MSTYHAQQTWRANSQRQLWVMTWKIHTFLTSTRPSQDKVSKVKTHLHICRFSHFHTSTLPHFHTSTLPHFRTSTLPHFCTSTLLHFHTFRLPDFRLPHYRVKIEVSKVTTRLYISRFAHALPHFQLLHFHTSTLPHIYTSTHLHFHTTKLRYVQVSLSHISRFKVTLSWLILYAAHLHCDDVFCALLTQVKAHLLHLA